MEKGDILIYISLFISFLIFQYFIVYNFRNLFSKIQNKICMNNEFIFYFF